MNSDMSFHARRDRALNQLNELIREHIEYEEPTFQAPLPRLKKELSLLSDYQVSDATMYFILDEYRVQNNPFGEFSKMSESFQSFQSFSAAQQGQVVKLYNILLEEHGLVLNWYETYGQHGGYRFELDFHLRPVTSR